LFYSLQPKFQELGETAGDIAADVTVGAMLYATVKIVEKGTKTFKGQQLEAGQAKLLHQQRDPPIFRRKYLISSENQRKSTAETLQLKKMESLFSEFTSQGNMELNQIMKFSFLLLRLIDIQRQEKY